MRMHSKRTGLHLAVGIMLCIFLAGLVCAEETPSLLSQADAAYAKREDLPQAKIAMELYERSAAANPGQAIEAYWKAARAAWWLGENQEEKAEKLQNFQTSMTLAQKAIDLDTNSVEGHFWLGAAMGTYGKAKGVMKSLALVKPIRHEMAEVIRINDHYQNGAAYRVLGVVDYKVPGMMGGNKKRAKEELDKALTFSANDPFVYYDYVDFYKTTGDLEKSKAALETLHHLQVPPEMIPELNMLKRKADKL